MVEKFLLAEAKVERFSKFTNLPVERLPAVGPPAGAPTPSTIFPVDSYLFN